MLLILTRSVCCKLSSLYSTNGNMTIVVDAATVSVIVFICHGRTICISWTNGNATTWFPMEMRWCWNRCIDFGRIRFVVWLQIEWHRCDILRCNWCRWNNCNNIKAICYWIGHCVCVIYRCHCISCVNILVCLCNTVNVICRFGQSIWFDIIVSNCFECIYCIVDFDAANVVDATAVTIAAVADVVCSIIYRVCVFCFCFGTCEKNKSEQDNKKSRWKQRHENFSAQKILSIYQIFDRLDFVFRRFFIVRFLKHSRAHKQSNVIVEIRWWQTKATAQKKLWFIAHWFLHHWTYFRSNWILPFIDRNDMNGHIIFIKSPKNILMKQRMAPFLCASKCDSFCLWFISRSTSNDNHSKFNLISYFFHRLAKRKKKNERKLWIYRTKIVFFFFLVALLQWHHALSE